jgi:glycosyltransferase involved in cell wall biosynthesis
MKILLVHDYGTPDGGAEIATLSLRDGLRRRGHEALLLATDVRGSVPSQADVACTGGGAGYRGRLVQTANFSARRAMQRTLAEFDPDVVHVGLFLTQLSPLILPLLRDVPSVYYAHWLRAICPTGSKQLPDDRTCGSSAGIACYRSGCVPLRDWFPLMGQMHLTRRWRGTFRRIVANSEATRTALEADGFTNVSVIPCGVPTRARGPALGGAPLVGEPVACFSGRLTRQKGVHVLLAAWRSVRDALPHAQLLIAGDGPERVVLEATAPPGVTFLGAVPHADLHRATEAAWVQVVPSSGFEGLGLAAVEAMMRGRAVVASRIGGLSEVVQPDVTGALVEPNDPASLATALIALLGDRDRCEQLGARAREVAERSFSQDTYVDRLLALYEGLVAEHRAVR